MSIWFVVALRVTVREFCLPFPDEKSYQKDEQHQKVHITTPFHSAGLCRPRPYSGVLHFGRIAALAHALGSAGTFRAATVKER